MSADAPHAAIPNPLVRMRGIGKRFSRTVVLDGVDFDLAAGEIHVLAGENGAGKSTLIRVLGGVYPDAAGTIEIAGRPVRLRTPHDAARHGIAVIHQELALVPAMSIAENVFLGDPPSHAGFVDRARRRRLAAGLLRRVGLEDDVDRPLESLPVAGRQQVEIAKALRRDARVLVMDEPTSALNAVEAEALFRRMGELKAQGRAIVFITHRLEEIGRLADRITVLRDGRLVGSAPARDLPPGELVRWMVGRDVAAVSRRRRFERAAKEDAQGDGPGRPEGPPRLSLRRVSVAGGDGKDAVADVSLDLRAGEVVGLAGLRGAGSSELLLALFGGRGRAWSGEMRVQGQAVRPTRPAAAMRAGIALLTNDRATTGLVLPMSVAANAVMAVLRRLSPGGWRRPGRERAVAARRADALRLKAASLDMPVGELSGGNQQKVALGKWLETQPKILLLDEPTRGIDVGAKQEIYDLIDACTAEGMGILLITSEMPELLAMSDRIVVLHRGRITGRFGRGEATAEKVLAAAMGEKTGVG
jgi:ABC-type sugar transport system ATPase subunit